MTRERPTDDPILPLEARLIDAEERYRTLIETLPAVSYVELIDRNFTTIYVSPQVREIFGLSPEDYIANPRYWEEHLHPDDRQRVLREADDGVRLGEPFVQEYRMITEDGRTIWCWDKAAVISDDAGRPTLLQGMMLDITAQKLAETQVRHRDAILEGVLLASLRLLRTPDWELAVPDVLRALGEAASADTINIWTYQPASDGSPATSSLRFEWVGPGIAPRIDDPTHQGFRLDDDWAAWLEDMHAGRHAAGLAADRPTGEASYYESTGIRSIVDVPIFVEGELWGMIGFEDTQERTWSEGEVKALRAAAETIAAAIERERTGSQLLETEQRYQALVEQIPAVLYIDRPGVEDRTVYISPQLDRIIGLSSEEWIREPELWYRRLHPEDREGAFATYRQGIAAGLPFSFEYRLVTPLGTIWIRDDAVVLKDAGETLVQGVMFDITEQKLAEQALVESEGREREAAEELRTLDRMKNAFLEAVSHELRSPLTTVLGLSLTLERQEMPPEARRDLLARLSANARRLERLLTDLLDIDRLSRGAIEPRRHPVDVGEVVRATIAAADFVGERTVVPDTPEVIASVDGPKVERIIENLLVNAARHTPEGTTVWVRVEPTEDDGVLLTVEDDGPGISSEDRDLLFEPFRQGHVDTATPGTGIGLTLVSRFAELHGGRAWIEDRPGGGARFLVLLPGDTA